MKWLAITLLVLLSSVGLGEGLGPGARAVAPLLSAGRPDLRRSGAQPFVTILCKFQDVPSEPKSRADVEQIFAARNPGLDDYWREVSYDRINLEGSRVVGWYSLPHSRSAYMTQSAVGVDLQWLAQDCAMAADADVLFTNYVGINFVFSDNLMARPWGGNEHLTLDGSTRSYGVTWLWPQTLASQSTLVHEMGHALGLTHSSTGQDQVYDNDWDVMSNSGACSPFGAHGPEAQHMIAYDKDFLGWIPPERKFIAPPDTVSRIVLERLAQPGPGNYLMAVIPIASSSTHFYTVEARRRAGYDSQLAGDAVVIHEVDTTRRLPARLVNRSGDGDTRVSASMWLPGMVFEDRPNGVAVSVEGATPTGFTITIFTGPRPWVRSPAAGSVVPENDVSLTWQAVPGVRRYEVSARCVGPSGDALHVSSQVAHAAELTVALPRGDCEWQVRALPGGKWTPPSHIRVGRESGQWLPSELVRARRLEAITSHTIAVGASNEIYLAWADAPSRSTRGAVHVARRVGGAWEYAGLSGDSPAAQIGASPRLSLGPDGEVCAAWKYTSPPALGAGSSTAGDDSDLWYACWSSAIPGRPAASGHSTDETGTGGDARGVMRINQAGRCAIPIAPDLVTDWAGNSYAVWEELEPGGKADVYFARRAAGGVWTAESVISDDETRAPRWDPAIAVDAQGNTAAIWREGPNDSLDTFAASRPAGGAWQPSVRLTRAGTSNQQSPAIAVDGRGNAYAAWRSYCACGREKVIGDIQFAMRPAGGEWQPPITVAWDIGGRNMSGPAIAATTAGGVYLVWEEENRQTYTLYSAYRTVDGAWEPKMAIEDSAGNLAPANPVLAADASGNAYLAWIEHRDGESSLRFTMTR